MEILFQCKIPGRARIKKNSKRILRNHKTGASFIASSKEFKAWAIFAGFHVARMFKGKSIDYPVNLSVRCFYKNNQHAQDLDNVISSVSDILEDCGVLDNDKFIHGLDGCRKIFESDTDERIEITLSKIV